MSGVFVDRILRGIEAVAPLYEQLVLVVAPAGAGKTAALLHVAERTGYPYINVNLAFSELLLDVPLADRPMKASRLLDQLLDATDGPVLLDNLELLYDPALQIQPLNWLRRAARSRLIVATWNGVVEQGHLAYAGEGHPERRHEPAGDIVIITPEPVA
jgi:hypothetical protein